MCGWPLTRIFLPALVVAALVVHAAGAGVGARRPSIPNAAGVYSGCYAPVMSAANAARSSTVNATASCAAGRVLLGGGASVTTTASQKERVVLQASYPSSATTWTGVGVVAIAALGAGKDDVGDGVRALQPLTN
jgi:hypothetical protein